jgi:bacillopeptidase F
MGPVLDRLMREGAIDYVRPVAIVNRLVVEGSAAGILSLGTEPGVRRILPDWTSRQTGGRTGAFAEGLGETFRSWAVDAMGAQILWERGLDGSGVVVAAIDTGVFADHEQLAGRMLDGERGWYDPVEGRAEPYDTHGHGTVVLSQAVGGNPGGKVLGIAPGASWAVALGNLENHYSRARMTLAADWILRVARPDVLVNAWSHDEGPCVDFDLPFIDAWKAAEIFVVFPAGNSGPLPGSGESPAQLTGTYPDGRPVLSVAALARDLTPLPESSRGPGACGSDPFPSLAVPGADLPACLRTSPSGYHRGEGTSLAAGLLGGAAALLLQANPELSPSQLEDILLSSARDLPPGGMDTATGAGIVDLPAALELAQRIHSQP